VTAPGTLRPARGTPIHDPSRLSEREHQVLLGMSEGKSNGEIGRELFLAEDTIKTHARRMFRKLRVGDRAEAVAHGFRHNLLT
jgi:DNA-binding NarL/FixJ family response regulator